MTTTTKIRWKEKMRPRAVINARDLVIRSLDVFSNGEHSGMYFTVAEDDTHSRVSGYLDICRENNPKLSEVANNVYGGVGEMAFSRKADGNYLVDLKSRLIVNYCFCVMSAEEFGAFYENIRQFKAAN